MHSEHQTRYYLINTRVSVLSEINRRTMLYIRTQIKLQLETVLLHLQQPSIYHQLATVKIVIMQIMDWFLILAIIYKLSYIIYMCLVWH